MNSCKPLHPVLALTGGVLLLTGCHPPTASGLPTSGLSPSLSVDLGTFDAGDGKTSRVRIAVTPEQREILSDRENRISVHTNALDLMYAGSRPGYVVLEGTTHRVANCEAFSTVATVERDGETLLTLDLKAKVRRAFTITPIQEGKRYALTLAPGVSPPTVVSRPSEMDAKVVATGPRTAELILNRTAPPLVPGGVVRLLDRPSNDNRTIRLPQPTVSVSSAQTGTLVDKNGETTVRANSALTPDKPDVEIVLDPPGTYEIVRRGYANGKLTLVLRATTPVPTDVHIGFRRKGGWVEFQTLSPNLPR